MIAKTLIIKKPSKELLTFIRSERKRQETSHKDRKNTYGKFEIIPPARILEERCSAYKYIF